MNFKYSAIFQSTASVRKNPKGFSSKSIASVGIASEDLNKLRSLAAPDAEIKDNSSFLYIVANAAVVNLVNLNDDGIMTESAIAMKPYWKLQPINIEHDRRNVIGCITNSAFSDFATNELVESPSGSDPFNIAVSGVLWKAVDEYAADLVEDCSEEGFMCDMISTSWEIGFNEYVIAKGSKNLSKAEIVSDPEAIKALDGYLKCNGGNGFTPDGTELYRIVVGDCRPIGLALTMNPAAAVKGVKAITVEDEMETPEEEEDAKCGEDKMKASENEIFEPIFIRPKVNSPKSELESTIEATIAKFMLVLDEKREKEAENTKKSEEKAKKDEKNSPLIAQTQKTPVNNNTIMDKMTFQQALASVSVPEAKAAFEEAIAEAGKQLAQEKADKAKVEADFQASLENAKASEEKLANLEKQLADLQAAAAESAKQLVFSDRMATLAEKYDLDEKASKVVAKQIRDLDDEAFKTWMDEDGEVILARYEKTQPDVAEKATEALASVPDAKIDIPNTSSDKPKEKTLNIFAA